MLRLLQRLPKAISSGGGAVAVREPETSPLALLEFQSPTAAIIATPVPPLARLAGVWITLLVASFLIVAAVMPVEKIVESSGELVSTAATVVVQPFTTSIVKSINVQPGQFVHKGQVLATLDPTDAAADFTSLTQQEQGYAAQVAQLQAQEDGKPFVPDPNNPAAQLQMQTYTQQTSQYNFTVDDYAQKIAALQATINGYDQQAAYYRTRLALAENVETMRNQLQQLQVGSRLDTLSAQDDRVNMQSELASAISSAQQSKKDLASQEAERDAFIQQWKASISTQLAQALVNLSQTQDSLAKARLEDQLVVLTAPQDSVVLAIAPVSVGAVVQSGQTLMQTVPANAPLAIQAELDGTMDSGFVHPGQHVVIKFDTLPFLQFGSAKGVVQSVSASSFNPLDTQDAAVAGTPLPGTPETLFYTANISLEELNLHNLPKGFKLLPGMPLDADVEVGSRTVLAYFLRRIMPVAYDSFHEP
jgi:HlyD family secretion protein